MKPSASHATERSMVMTLRETLRITAERLRASGIDVPEYEARVLVADAYGLTLSQLDHLLIMREEPQSSSDVRTRWRRNLERRCAREPLQYILGHAPFRYLDVQVGPGVFIPRPETETVVQAGLSWLGEHWSNAAKDSATGEESDDSAGPIVVDLCAGSGAIGLSVVSEFGSARVWAVELSIRALTWTRRNRDDLVARQPDIAKRYHLIHADATDPATLADLDGKVDAVITNPPYVPQCEVPEQPEVRDHDPAMALYGGSSDGLRIPQEIIVRTEALLRPGGLLVMEHDIHQASLLVSYAAEHGFTHAATGIDLTGRPRYLTAYKTQ